MSRQYAVPLARHQVSVSSVVATTRLLVTPPRKCGPPESPRHVPASPVEGFCDNASRLGLNDWKASEAYRRNPSRPSSACDPPFLWLRTAP